MKSRYSQLLMLLGAILAFAPILAVDYLLDSYVRGRETKAAQKEVAIAAAQVRLGVSDALDALTEIIADSPSLCTPTFIANAQESVQAHLNLKQVLVENLDGVQYCDIFGRTVSYSPVSKSLSVAGQPETITVVRLGGLSVPALKITRLAGEKRQVSAFVPLLGQSPAALEASLPRAASMRVLLTTGEVVLTIGKAARLQADGKPQNLIVAQDFVGELPLKVEYAQPFAAARANYANLDVSITVIGGVMSGAFLILALQYVRRSRMPAFELERAISLGEIKPYYQPVINLRTGELVGCEVLCRWVKKNGKVTSPGVFIDYAEVTGLALPMTLSLMQQVKNDLGELCGQLPEMKVSINLFEGHFRDTGIVDDVKAIFGDSKINYRQLVFEITERRPLANSAVAANVIAGLHALGAKLALDDVGTGHSNLAYLATLGVDVIKIDRVFVDMVKPGTTQVPVLDGLIAMAMDLDCEIVAEGVETAEQAIYLRAHGVVQAQGFFFAPALTPGAFQELALTMHAAKATPPSLSPSIQQAA